MVGVPLLELIFQRHIRHKCQHPYHFDVGINVLIINILVSVAYQKRIDFTINIINPKNKIGLLYV